MEAVIVITPPALPMDHPGHQTGHHLPVLDPILIQWWFDKENIRWRKRIMNLLNSSVFNAMLTFELEQLLIALAHLLVQDTIATAFHLNRKVWKKQP